MVSFNTAYEPGKLEAIGSLSGVAVVTNTLVTAGAPAALRVELDRDSLPADGRSVAHAVVSVVDVRGNLVYQARDPIKAVVSGAGRLLGVDNGDLNDSTPLSMPEKKANGGQILVLLQALHEAGSMTIEVSAPGLKGASLRLKVSD